MKYLYLDSDEEITSVIDKVKKTPETEIVLVFSKDTAMLRSMVSLKLLKRQTATQNKQLVISTKDEVGYNLAHRAGFLTTTETEPNKIKIENLIKGAGFPDLPKIAATHEKQKESEKEKAPKHPGRVSLLSGVWVKILIFLLVFLIPLGYLCFFVLPKAKVKIVPKTESFSKEIDLVVNAKIDKTDLEKRILKGIVQAKEEEINNKKIDVRGEKEVGSKAQGTVEIFNKYSSKTQVLPQGTRFVTTKGGLVFLSLEDAEVAGANVEGGTTNPGRGAVKVEAEKGGEEYNIKSAVFNIVSLPAEKQTTIWGETNQEFSGGKSKKIRAVSDDDIKRAKDELKNEAEQKAMEEMKKSVADNQLFFENVKNTEIISAEADTKKDQEASTFNISGKTKTKTLICEKNDLEKVLFGALEKELGDQKMIVDKSLKEGINYEIKEYNANEDRLILKVKVLKAIAEKFDVNTLKSKILGLNKPTSLEKLLANPKIQSADVSFWPIWVNRVPNNPQKIEISIDIIRGSGKMEAK